MAVLTWSMFWIWLALVGLAGGAGTDWLLLVATARLGTAMAMPAAADAIAMVAVRVRPELRRESFTGVLRVSDMNGRHPSTEGQRYTRPRGVLSEGVDEGLLEGS